jgi:hypothetical protein
MDSIRRVSQEIEGAENARWLAAWGDLQAGAQRGRLVRISKVFFAQ